MCSLDSLGRVQPITPRPAPQPDDGDSCLSAACDVGNVDMVRSLLKHGADPNTKSDAGDTPLSLAKAAGGKLIMAKSAKTVKDTKPGKSGREAGRLMTLIES